MSPLIEVNRLSKVFRRPRQHSGFLGAVRTLVTRQYDEVYAVDDVSFSVKPGELIGYLGPNGAGKSTTIRMMTGILRPTSGSITVGGLVPWKNRERNALQIGVVFGQRSQLWWDLPLIDSLQLIGKLYRMSPEAYRRNLSHFVDMLDMGSFLDQPARQLSLGQRMRGDLAAAMLHQPQLLFLDEPTIGLDAIAKMRMRTFIKEMNRARGTTIVLTTHDLSDIERLCERVVFIDHGKVVYDAGVEQLKRRYAPHRILVVEIDVPSSGVAPIVRLPAGAAGEVIEQDGAIARIRFEATTTSAQEVIAAVSTFYSIKDLRLEEPDMETVVRQFYGDRDLVS